jgi:hypothetical protein
MAGGTSARISHELRLDQHELRQKRRRFTLAHVPDAVQHGMLRRWSGTHA